MVGGKRMKRREFVRQSFIGLSAVNAPLLLSAPANARLPGTVTWGGAYILEDEPGLMLYTRQALAMTPKVSPTGESANGALLREIRATDWSDTALDLRTGLDRTQTRYGMVFALASEQVLATVFLEKLSTTQYILRQIGYVTIYDIFERRIVACLAVRGRYLDEKPGRPDESLLPELFFNMLANVDQSGSIARFMTERLTDYPFEEKYEGKYFQVEPVRYTDLARLHVEQYDIDLARYGDDIGFAVTTAFSENLVSPILPYRKTTAVNRDMLSEMKILAMNGESPLNTALALKPADAAIEVTHRGWEFANVKTSSTRNQVALVTSLVIRIYDKQTSETYYNQGFYARQDFNEIFEGNLGLDRKSRLFMLHETILDRAFGAIASEQARGILYDGEETSGASVKTFVQAEAEDWDSYSAECERIRGLLPSGF